MAMNKWVKRKWVRALRSGEYTQGQGWLNPTENTYCCLGVLGAEMVPEFCNSADGPYGAGTVAGEDTYLPDDLAILYGLDGQIQSELGELNDSSDGFGIIADWIEANL